MPTYVYFCSDCIVEFEVIQGINELACADCPHCLFVSNQRIPQMFGMVDKTPRTLGGLADKNRSEMSQAQYDERMQTMANERKQLTKYGGYIPEGAELKEKDSFKRPWWRPDRDTPDASLSKLTDEQKIKYAFEGKKPAGLE